MEACDISDDGIYSSYFPFIATSGMMIIVEKDFAYQIILQTHLQVDTTL
jgi:hypothetical protein